MKYMDWVTKRADCSLVGMFQQLKSDVEGDVRTRNRIEKASSARRCFGFMDHGQSFSVFTEGVANPVIVNFKLAQSAISVSNDCISLVATLTLNDEGECRFVVDGVELDGWQFRKRSLEPLFFGTES